MKIITVFLGLSIPATAASIWSEGAIGQGDLSDDYLTPNRFTLNPGSNFLSAEVNSTETVPGTFVANEDFFTLIVPPGFQLESVFLLNYTFGGPSGNKTFIGFQDGPTLQRAPSEFTASTASEISNLLFNRSEVISDPDFYLFDPTETNLLDTFSAGSNSSPGPLPPGEYAFWLREIEPEIARFTFDFVTTPVPEPSTILLVVLSSLGLFRRQR